MDAVIFKGVEVTRQMVLDAMRRFDKEDRESYVDPPGQKFQVLHDGDKYPPKRIMSIASGIPFDRFAGGEYTNRPLRELGFNVPQPPEDGQEEAIETALRIEGDLEDYLAAHLEQVEAGLKPYEGKARQFEMGPVGRLDLLAVAQNGDVVVLELKAGEADDRACGQILGYMGWIKDNLAGKRQVRGIIVANDFTERLISAARAIPSLTLTRYDVTFHFGRVAGGGAEG